MQKQYIVIDFGTTTTAVYGIIKELSGNRYQYYGDETGAPFTSIVALPKDPNGVIRFGREVRQSSQELAQTHVIIKSMKTYLGENKEFVVGGKKYDALGIAKAYLKYLKDYMRNRYSVEINEATMAFPVDFSPEARMNLKKAAKEAGIEVKGFISESTAAYIASRDKTKAFKKVMVIDWGGGTLDISILRLEKNTVHEEAVYGEQIGGDDIDKLIAYSVHADLVSKTGINVSFDDMSPQDKDQLINVCETAKIEFSDFDDDYDIRFRNYGEFGNKVSVLSYDTFESILMPIIRDRVLKIIDTAMAKANTSKAGIDLVIMSGGSSMLRPFENAMVKIFGDKVILPDDAQWAVAKGAAMLAMTSSKQYLNEDIGVVLSDRSVFPLLRKDRNFAGQGESMAEFALTEDSQNANFVFANTGQSIIYGNLNVDTKGYLGEKLKVRAKIDDSQIAIIKVENRSMGEHYCKTIKLNKLPFYYKLIEFN